MRRLFSIVAFAFVCVSAVLAQDTRTPSRDDIPQSGASLFDAIFSVETGGVREHHVPFPFSRFRNEISRRLGLQTSELKEVLIPLGRALQREAAAPHFYRSPRHVLVVDTEPRQDLAPNRVSAKDRLFVGYQEMANSLEVISYNEASGRFEFQIVDDYAPGKTPRVRYARRSVCISCHQNGAPLFPEAPWSETDANPEVHKRLTIARQAFHGLRIRPSAQAGEHARAIANAVERANTLPLLQSIWRLGCSAGVTIKRAADCRANMFLLALLRRLSTSPTIDTTSSAYQEIVRPTFQRTWAKLWPTGLPLPAHLIPDRDPIELGASVTQALDPLSSREPHEIWRADRQADFAKAISAMAQTFEESNIRLLDTYLAKKRRTDDVQRQTMIYPCSFSKRPYFDGDVDRILFSCTRSDRRRGIFNGHFYLSPRLSPRGHVDVLQLPTGEIQTQLRLKGGTSPAAINVGRLTLQTSDEITGRSVRRADGWALENIRLVWSSIVTEKFDSSAEIPSYPRNGKAVLTFVNDVEPMRVANHDSRRSFETAQTVFGNHPFSRHRLMAELFGRLELPHPDVNRLALRRPDPTRPSNGAADNERSFETGSMISLFQRHCSACHQSGSRFPPNFLDGKPQDRIRNIAHCAERIAYRLAMWVRSPSARKKSPMPPPAYLESTGVSLRAWQNSKALSALLEHTVRLIDSTYDEPSLTSVLFRPYAALRRCMPKTD